MIRAHIAGFLQHRFIEVQARCWRCDSAGVAGVDSLIALYVANVCIATEIRRQWDFAEGVKAMTELRSSLKKSGAEYVVVKNRLAKRVFVESEELPDIS